jgi:hypothetical protein
LGNSTVSITTQVWGEQYAQFIPRWWESVKSLSRKPDEIVLVTNLDDSRQLLSGVPDWVDVPIVEIRTQHEFMHQWATTAVHACTSEWIAGVAVDDQFAPTALDPIDTATGDFLVDRVEFLTGGEWPASWSLPPRNRRFAPAGISPFRRKLLPIWDLIPEDCHWNDYVWYLLLAKHEVQPEITNNLRMIHDLGHNHETMSGVNMNPNTRTMADSQLAKIRSQLGI